MTEIKRVKQAIVEGRLWEHLKTQSFGHPALFSALKRLGKYTEYMETDSPVSKSSGLFFYDAVDLARPEVLRHSERLRDRYAPSKNAKVLLLLPQTRAKPFHKSREHARIIKGIEQSQTGKKGLIHLCTYAAPFGVVPVELDEIYPLSQHEVALPLDYETIKHVAEQVGDYIRRSRYTKVILLNDRENWGNEITSTVRSVCRNKKTPITVLNPANPWDKSAVNALSNAVQKAVDEQT